MLVIGPHGRALRGDASIAPYIPFTDGTVGRGLDPSYAVCNDGNIYHLLHNKKSYVGGGVPDAPDGAYVIACGGARPRPTNRWKTSVNIQTVNHAHLRADMESAPTVARCGLPYGRRGRLVAKTTATSQQSWPARAVQCPTGALIATQPRNSTSARPGRRGRRPLQMG